VKNVSVGAVVGISMLVVQSIELTLSHYGVERTRSGSVNDGFRRTVGFVEFLLSKRSKVYGEIDVTH
jgi:hypothetical protein